MSQRARDMAALARVTKAAFDAEQARMAALKRQEVDLRQRIAELDRPRRDDSLPLHEDAALRAGAALNWQIWVDRRRSELNTELARTLVAQAQVRAALARSFGRNVATRDLAEKAHAATVARLRKRAERDA